MSPVGCKNSGAISFPPTTKKCLLQLFTHFLLAALFPSHLLQKSVFYSYLPIIYRCLYRRYQHKKYPPPQHCGFVCPLLQVSGICQRTYKILFASFSPQMCIITQCAYSAQEHCGRVDRFEPGTSAPEV